MKIWSHRAFQNMKKAGSRLLVIISFLQSFELEKGKKNGLQLNFLVNGGQDFHGLLLQASIGLRKYFLWRVVEKIKGQTFSNHCFDPHIDKLLHSRDLHQSVRESAVGMVHCTGHFTSLFNLSVPDRLKILKGKIQVIPKRDTHLGNLGRGGRYTKFEENRTNIK